MTSPLTLSSAVLEGGQLLRAEAAPGRPDDRIREGLLVPWNEDGRTNLGRGFPVRPEFGQALQAAAKIVGVYGHRREGVEPLAVSRVLEHQVRPEGLWARIYVNATPLGDQLLAEIDGGARDGLSIEASDLVLDAAGGVVAGSLDFFAHVPVGAYSSARALALAASAITTNGAPVTLPAQPAPAAPALPAPVLQATYTPGTPAPAAPAFALPAQPAPAAPAPADVAGQLQTLLASLQPAPAAPAPVPAPAAPADVAGMLQLLQGLAQLQAGAHVAPPAGPSAASLLATPGVPAAQGGQTLQAEVDPITHAATLAAEFHRGGRHDGTLLAALQDVTASGLPLFQENASRLGEKLWEGTKDTTRPFWDLMAPGELTSMTYFGWEWTSLPEMQAWDGDKTEITGNPVGLRQVPFEARRAAAGWDVDRKFKDFGDALFWQEFFTEQTNAYRRLTNSWAQEALVAAAIDVTVAGSYADAGTPGPIPVDYKTLVPATGVPEGVTQLLQAAAIARVILEGTPRVEQGPDYVLVNTLDWLRLSELASVDLPAFLTLLKIDPNGFRPSVKVPRGRMIAGVRGAMRARELPGSQGKGSPIRVEALDVARGGVDSAVYGYVGISRERVGGVISVPLDEPA